MLPLCVFLGLVFDTGLQALQKVLVPQLGIPGKEPAGEGEWLLPLLNGADGDTAAARGVRTHIIIRWKEKKTHL